jgi:thiamine-monophosphate kinase
MESQFYHWLQSNLSESNNLRLGIGDDAAILNLASNTDTVVTTDMLTAGVDFLIEDVDLKKVGHKALAVNLSDLAAMAANPIAVVVSLALPEQGIRGRSAYELAVTLYEGMFPLAEQFEVAIAGGDTNTWHGPLAISITAIGSTTHHGPLLRRGAVSGDLLLVTGLLGGSILGWHLEVQPRVHEALLLNERYELHAAIDVSDGLALDCSRLAIASNCGAALELGTIPIAPAAHQLASQDNHTPLEHALGDGEDFELVLAVPPQVAQQILQDQPLEIPITHIGQMIDQPGLWQQDQDGKRKPLEPTGWLHGGEVGRGQGADK